MRIKLLRLCLLYSFLIMNSAKAQKEFNIWYVGSNAGLDFNSGSPVALTNGMLDTWEGCSSISDANGNLLFYTDGIKVWDRNHNQMPNGDTIGGNESSCQAALIVQFPGNNSMYYIFTTEEVFSSQNFAYSVVDMSLNNSNGDVTTKNNILISPTAEKLAAVKHANNTDIWIMVHDAAINSFYSYLVTAGGISATPVVSSIGQSLVVYDVTGQMKFSPDGSKIAFGAETNNFVDLFDFNSITGQVTNEIYLNVPGIDEYGLEFSAGGNYLYAAAAGTSSIYQWDITSNNSATINASIQLIGTSTAIGIGSLQLGPDRKIYVIEYEDNYLGVINYPDSAGISCNYIDNAIWLGGKTCQLGLPHFISSHFLPTGINTKHLQQNQLTISPNPATDNIYISFPATASENITIKIFSTTGEIVFEKLFHPDSYRDRTLEKMNIAIDVTGLSNGIYFLSVQTGKEVITKKIVINR